VVDDEVVVPLPPPRALVVVVVAGTVVLVEDVVAGTVEVVAGTVVLVVVVIAGTVEVVAGTVVLVVVVVAGTVVVVAGTVVVVAGTVVVVAGTVLLVEVVVEEVVVGARHTGLVTVFESRVTAPLRASKRPWTVAFVFAVIDVKARMVPMKVEPTPRVAELPTCQKTLQGWAPLMSTTLLLGAVMSVDAAWKMKTAFGSPWASRVSGPVIANESAL
jgi:hypothetical protein